MNQISDQAFNRVGKRNTGSDLLDLQAMREEIRALQARVATLEAQPRVIEQTIQNYYDGEQAPTPETPGTDSEALINEIMTRMRTERIGLRLNPEIQDIISEIKRRSDSLIGKSPAQVRLETRNWLNEMAADVAIGSGSDAIQFLAVKRTQKALAAASLRLRASITEVENDITAYAEAILAAQTAITDLESGQAAQSSAILDLESQTTLIEDELATQASAILDIYSELDGISVNAFIKFETTLPPPDGVAAQVKIMARATNDDDDFVESGIIIQVVEISPGVYESRILLTASKIMIGDLAANTFPFVIVDGQVFLQNLNIGEHVFKKLNSFDGKLQLSGHGGTWIRMTTGA